MWRGAPDMIMVGVCLVGARYPCVVGCVWQWVGRVRLQPNSIARFAVDACVITNLNCLCLT